MKSIELKRKDILKQASSIAYYQKGLTVKENVENRDKAVNIIVNFMEEEGEFAEGLVQAAGHLLLGSQGLFNYDIRDKAILMTDKAVQLEPYNKDVLEEALFIYSYTLGEYQEKNGKAIVEIANRLLKIDPNNVQGILSYYLYGRYNPAFSIDTAIKLLEKARTIDPSRTDVVLDLGSAYFEAKQYDKALEYYKLYVKIEPKHSGGAQERIGIIEKKVNKSAKKSREK
jgi:tetratricopeptide (TPR) repeat protein